MSNEEDHVPERTDDRQERQFEQIDLTGARFRKVQLNDAHFRMVDLSGAVMRDVSLAGVSIDGSEIVGLRINGIEIAPLIEAELTRREPARALKRSADPSGLRDGWSALQQSWAAAYERVTSLPAGSADVSVSGEWSFTQTLRHLVFATDAWLGAVTGDAQPFHPWGAPFDEIHEFLDAELVAGLGLDEDATPSYAEVLELRADRVARVRDFLSTVGPDRLTAEVEGPVWENGAHLSVQRCLWVILNEEWEHLRFASRDLDVIEASLPDRSDQAAASAG